MVKYCIFFLLLATISFRPVAQPCYGDYSCSGKKRINFYLEQVTSNSSLKFDGVYTSLDSCCNTNKGFNYIRFFQTGDAFVSCGYCSPKDTSQFDNLEYGYPARYATFNDTLVLEYFSAYLRYHYDYYLLKGEEIMYFGWSKRNLFKNIFTMPAEYKKFRPAKLSNSPSW